ncbi:MAG: hypothetical protein IKB65_09440 [Ruminiclostridium sp.]|nr:hypothetical protein [Ruminiclostridium sp.]
MDDKRNGKTISPADAAASFLQQEDTAAEAHARMLQRMGLGREDRDSDRARQRMIDRQTRRE